jgi:2-polyprenyl-3-methyl-5-hydroxy-6-metoxy-1,4-benzoquinol methylase
LSLYRRRFYDFQTQARRLTSREALEKAFNRDTGRFRAMFAGILPRSRAARILDCGCGFGNVLYQLRSLGFERSLGIDADPKQVALAQSLGLPARRGEILSFLKKQKAAWDVLFAVDFIEHLTKDQAIRFLDAAARALKPGGLLLLRTPCCDGLFGAAHRHNDITHEWGLTSVAAENLLRMCAFEDIRILDERPRRPQRLWWLRVPLFYAARLGVSAVVRCLGLPPVPVWSLSMWVLGRIPGPISSQR